MVKAATSWEAMKKIGVTGVEVEVNFDMKCPNLFPDDNVSLASLQSIKRIRNELSENGLHISAFMMANRFDERPEEELQWVSKVVAACKALQVRAIRLDVVPRKIKREEFLPFAISIGKRMVELVENTNIGLGIENHGHTTNDPEFLEALFNGVGSEKLGLTLDTANLYWFGHPLDDLYGIYEKFAARAFHTHCKSIRYPEEKRNVRRERGWEYGKYNCPIYDGDIDFKRVVSILKAANYEGDFCIENESLGKYPQEQRENVLKKEADLLRSLI